MLYKARRNPALLQVSLMGKLCRDQIRGCGALSRSLSRTGPSTILLQVTKTLTHGTLRENFNHSTTMHLTPEPASCLPLVL